MQETARVDELRCNPFSARIVYLFSEDGSGELTFQKFINMMSVFSGRTSRQTKAVWAFALWDFDGETLSSSQATSNGGLICFVTPHFVHSSFMQLNFAFVLALQLSVLSWELLWCVVLIVLLFVHRR